MRIAIAHNKTVAQVMESADQAVDHVFKGLPVGPIEIVEQRKHWSGAVMTFHLTAKVYIPAYWGCSTASGETGIAFVAFRKRLKSFSDKKTGSDIHRQRSPIARPQIRNTASDSVVAWQRGASLSCTQALSKGCFLSTVP